MLTPNEIGLRIMAARQNKSMSKATLAELSGIPLASIAAYEAGKRTPSDRTKFRLARALDCDVATMFFTPEG